MSVASHLGIRLADYDARIRTFIPDYEEMLDVAARAVPPRARVIVDLGVGTGALAARCRIRAPRAHIVGIDSDSGVLTLAARRLKRRVTFVAGSFLRAPLPACDAVVASFALHHVPTLGARRALYRRIHAALSRRGRFVTVDCHPARDPELARTQRKDWLTHLSRSYGRAKAAEFLRSWAREDVYVPLESEIDLMQRSGFAVELLWRTGSFAVLRAASEAAV